MPISTTNEMVLLLLFLFFYFVDLQEEDGVWSSADRIYTSWKLSGCHKKLGFVSGWVTFKSYKAHIFDRLDNVHVVLWM